MKLPAGWASGTEYKYGDRVFEGAGIETVYFDGDFRDLSQLGDMIFGENYDVTIYCPHADGIIGKYFSDYNGHALRMYEMTELDSFAYEVVNGNEIKIKKYLGTDKTVVVSRRGSPPRGPVRAPPR